MAGVRLALPVLAHQLILEKCWDCCQGKDVCGFEQEPWKFLKQKGSMTWTSIP